MSHDSRNGPRRPVFTEDATLPTSRDAVGSGARLIVFGEGDPASFPLEERGTYTIGRSLEADIYIKDPSLSRLHALLTVGADGMSIRDLGSSNGTRLRGQALPPEADHAVRPGEPVDLGRCTLVVQTHGAPLERPRRVWPHSYMELRLEDLCARRKGGAGFVVLRLRVQPGEASIASVEGALTTLLGPDDPIARYAPTQYDVLLASAEGGEVEEAIGAIGFALERLGAKVDIASAYFPRDGRDPSELIASLSVPKRDPVPGARPDPAGVIVESPSMQRLYDLVERIASSDIAVLVLGETGVGKELMARAVHDRSRRAARPFLALNCGAFSDELLESELFGHERGAFTGAVKSKLGLLETVQGGTIFLDEVGEMALGTQVKLLRVLEERRMRRLGGIETVAIEARFIAATNRDLEKEVRLGRFRDDLYYRLNGFTLVIPPLRERRDEIPSLARAFARVAAHREGFRGTPKFTSPAMERLCGYAWPGNVRELKNVVERAVVLSAGESIDVSHLPVEKLQSSVIFPGQSRPQDEGQSAAKTIAPPPPMRAGTDEETLSLQASPVPLDPGSLQDRLGDVEREAILDALERCGGNQTRAAQALGMSRKTLLRRLDQYGIPRPRKGRDSD